MKKRALISVSDKTGIVAFAKQLLALDYEIISTGGTKKMLDENGIACISVSDITKFPECLDGRVKTLHPNIHAGILAMHSREQHMKQLDELHIATIDMVVVNLYPFRETVAKENVLFTDAVENIDIGGPAMLRSAAKNYQDVIVIVDPNDYETVLQQLKENGTVDIQTRKRLMYEVYRQTAVYDTMIADYLFQQSNMTDFPKQISFAYERKQLLRYGENAHQSAAFYQELSQYPGSITSAEQLQGKELSYNNINDANAALDLLREFHTPTVVALKHANPCGVGSATNLMEAYKKAYQADAVSIFGGIIAANGIIDDRLATQLGEVFLEIVIAKGFTKSALQVLSKKKNLRLLKLDTDQFAIKKNTYDMKKVLGGLLVQQYDDSLFLADECSVVTAKKPSEQEMLDLTFAMKIAKHAKSNAIVLAKDQMTVGIGAGQTNRIWATQQAIDHAKAAAQGSVLASDAFFPFSDCVEQAAKAGITAIIQPGGSIRDQDSIDCCNQAGISMVFCSRRHFKH